MMRIVHHRPYRLALLTWLAIWPTISVLLFAGDPILAVLPLPLRTLLLTAILVPFMSFVAMPKLTEWTDRMLGQASPGGAGTTTAAGRVAR